MSGLDLLGAHVTMENGSKMGFDITIKTSNGELNVIHFDLFRCTAHYWLIFSHGIVQYEDFDVIFSIHFKHLQTFGCSVNHMIIFQLFEFKLNKYIETYCLV